MLINAIMNTDVPIELYELYYKIKTRKIPVHSIDNNAIAKLNGYVLSYFKEVQKYTDERLSSEKFKKRFLIKI